MEARDVMSSYRVRVVSMPSADRFEEQGADYRESVLPAAVRVRVAVEAGVTDSWRKYVGLEGAVVGIDTFGESAPAEEVFKYLGITTDRIVETVEKVLSNYGASD
jgi:transketolase